MLVGLVLMVRALGASRFGRALRAARQSEARVVTSGIDVRLVVETGLAPVINTGIAHREPGIGQVGAGVVRAPMDCFRQAVVAIAEDLGVS